MSQREEEHGLLATTSRQRYVCPLLCDLNHCHSTQRVMDQVQEYTHEPLDPLFWHEKREMDSGLKDLSNIVVYSAYTPVSFTHTTCIHTFPSAHTHTLTTHTHTRPSRQIQEIHRHLGVCPQFDIQVLYSVVLVT